MPSSSRYGMFRIRQGRRHESSHVSAVPPCFPTSSKTLDRTLILPVSPGVRHSLLHTVRPAAQKGFSSGACQTPLNHYCGSPLCHTAIDYSSFSTPQHKNAHKGSFSQDQSLSASNKATASKVFWSASVKRPLSGLSISSRATRVPSLSSSGTTNSLRDASSQAICPGNR